MEDFHNLPQAVCVYPLILNLQFILLQFIVYLNITDFGIYRSQMSPELWLTFIILVSRHSSTIAVINPMCFQFSGFSLLFSIGMKNS